MRTPGTAATPRKGNPCSTSVSWGERARKRSESAARPSESAADRKSGRMTRAGSKEIDGGHSHRRGVSERQEMVPGAERVRCHPRTGDSQDGPQSVVAGIEAKSPKPQDHQ